MRTSLIVSALVAGAAVAGASTASAGQIHATRNGTTLYIVYPIGATLTPVANYPIADDGEAIAYHPQSDNFYRWTGFLTATSTIDPSNAYAETPLPNSGVIGEEASATWDAANNRFFVTANAASWRTMTTSGTFSAGASFGSAPAVRVRGVAFVGGVLYGLENAGTVDGGVVDLLTIDPNTGAILSNVDVAIPGYAGNGAFGLAFDPDTNTLYAALGALSTPNGRFLASIDPTTGVGTHLGAFSVPGINSLAVLPFAVLRVPEPATLGPIAIVVAGTMLRRRRRHMNARRQ